MSRWPLFIACLVSGVALFIAGLLVPAHLRAVDARLLKQAGANTPSVIDQGLALVKNRNLGAAQLLLQAARQQNIPGREKLRSAANTLARQNPGLEPWGAPSPLRFNATGPSLRNLDATSPSSADDEAPDPVSAGGKGTNTSARASGAPAAAVKPGSVVYYVIRLGNRERVLDQLRASSIPAIQQLLQFRTVTNTVLFPPSQSASGQALDAALSICGLLIQGNHLSVRLGHSISALAASADLGGNTQPFEEILMDFLSLGQRLNWGQLTAFVSHINDPETLRRLADLSRQANDRLPVLFAAVQVSGEPAAVSRYLMTFSRTGLADLGSSLHYGAGGVKELLHRNQRLETAAIGPALALGLCLRTPWLAVTVKWLFYLLSGFLLAAAAHFARRPAGVLERPLVVRGFHVAREILFALGFLLVVLLLSEPFLAQESQKAVLPFRLHLPLIGRVVPAGTTSVHHSSIMDQLSLLAILLFFVLQALLYTASVFKLAEIRRQKVPARMKLRLLENEDHLFDAGLYLGFVGTIICLILVSLGIIKPSLMAAYSSTSFGILFVSFFKIFHLRPARRRLLLEAEAAGTGESPGAAGRPALAVHL